MPINSFENYPMSWKPDKEKLARPIYQSLAEQMEKDIAEGFLLPGTKLPPQRELADYLDINFTTVTRAYKLCEYKGLIQSVMGSGTFVSASAGTVGPMINMMYQSNVIEMGPISCFEETNDLVVPMIRSVLNHMYPEQFLTYREPAGLSHQRQAASEWLSMLGVHVSYDELVIMTGAQNALTLTLLTLFNPGDRIVVDSFTYANFVEVAKLNHLTLVPVRGDSQGMLPGELDALCKQVKISGIFLIPSCHNPTTLVMSAQRKEEIAAVVKKHDLILIEDDADAFMTYGYVEDCGEPFFSMLPDNCIYICSMSKSVCSGLRVAYIAVPRKLAATLERTIFNTNVKTSSLDAEIITQAITTGTAAKIVERRIELAEEANRIYYEIFADYFKKKKIPLPKKENLHRPDHLMKKFPDGSHPLPYYKWLPVDTDESIQAVSARLLSRGVSLYDSSKFLCDSKVKDKFLRISLSTAGSMELLRQGLTTIKEEICR